MKKKGNFEYSVHADKTRGPNRVSRDSTRAVRDFKKVKNRGLSTEAVVRVVHLPTGLVFETDSVDDLQYFAGRMAFYAKK